VQSREGEVLLQRHARLAAWWQHLRQRPSFAATEPGLP
jgi:glutathione S-transferase